MNTVIKSVTNGAFASSTNTVVSRYFIAHPAYGINAGSAGYTMYNNTLISANGAGYGWFNRFIIRRWRMTIRLQNLEAFAVTAMFLPYPYLSASSLQLGSPGYQKLVSGFRGCKTISLAPVTLPNSIKTITLDVDAASLEGISRQGMEQTGYWCTGANFGALNQGALLQLLSIGGSLGTTAGYIYQIDCEYFVDAIGNSVTTIY